MPEHLTVAEVEQTAARGEPWATLAACAEYLERKCTDVAGVGMEDEAGLLDRVRSALAAAPGNRGRHGEDL